MEPRDVHSFWGIYSLGDLSSLLAFLITILNGYLISSIKQRIMINVTIVPLRDRLRSDSLELNNSLAYFETSIDEFNQALGICVANVKAVRRRLGIWRGWFSRELLKAANKYDKQRNRNNGREVFNRLAQVIQHLDNLIEERRIIGS